MPRVTKRRLIVSLPVSAYRQLEALAARDDRVANQEASYLLRRLLEGDEQAAPDEQRAEEMAS